MKTFIPYSLTNQRWETFKNHRRGMISFWILIILCIISLFAEFIANNKPIFIAYNNDFYSPLFFNYPETTFGGQLPSDTNYFDPAIIENIHQHGWIIWPLVKTNYNCNDCQAKTTLPSPPSVQNWLGTTDNGCDVFTIILYGFRLAMLFALLLTLCIALIGIIVGTILGYYASKMNLSTQRLTKIAACIPQWFLFIILSSFIAPSFCWLLIMMILFSWPIPVKIVKTEFLRTYNTNYVLAAKALGANNIIIIRKHIVPNIMWVTLTFLPFALCGSIAVLTILDFLGFGLPPSAPSIGRLLLQGKNNLHAPWLTMSAIGVITTVLTLLIFIGEAVCNSFHPTKQRLIL